MSDDWSKVIMRRDVFGYCSACGKKTYAVWTVFGDKSEVYRCTSCDTPNQFTPGDDFYDDATRWKPLGGDETDDKDSGKRYTKGRRY